MNNTAVDKLRACWSQNKRDADGRCSAAEADARGAAEMFAKHRHTPSTLLTVYGQRSSVDIAPVVGLLASLDTF